MLDEVRQCLDSEPWEDHIERLTLYAQRLISGRDWRGVVNGAVPGGKEAADFALEAISDLFEEKRKWNPKTHPSLIRFLFAAVKSEISNTVVSKSNQDRGDDSLPETGKKDDDTVLAIIDYVQDDAELCYYIEAIIDGYEDRADIAEYLNIKSSDVDNLRKKMKRRLDNYYKEIENHGN